MVSSHRARTPVIFVCDKSRLARKGGRGWTDSRPRSACGRCDLGVGACPFTVYTFCKDLRGSWHPAHPAFCVLRCFLSRRSKSPGPKPPCLPKESVDVGWGEEWRCRSGESRTAHHVDVTLALLTVCFLAGTGRSIEAVVLPVLPPCCRSLRRVGWGDCSQVPAPTGATSQAAARVAREGLTADKMGALLALQVLAGRCGGAVLLGPPLAFTSAQRKSEESCTCASGANCKGHATAPSRRNAEVRLQSQGCNWFYCESMGRKGSWRWCCCPGLFAKPIRFVWGKQLEGRLRVLALPPRTEGLPRCATQRPWLRFLSFPWLMLPHARTHAPTRPRQGDYLRGFVAWRGSGWQRGLLFLQAPCTKTAGHSLRMRAPTPDACHILAYSGV